MCQLLSWRDCPQLQRESASRVRPEMSRPAGRLWGSQGEVKGARVWGSSSEKGLNPRSISKTKWYLLVDNVGCERKREVRMTPRSSILNLKTKYSQRAKYCEYTEKSHEAQSHGDDLIESGDQREQRQEGEVKEGVTGRICGGPGLSSRPPRPEQREGGSPGSPGRQGTSTPSTGKNLFLDKKFSGKSLAFSIKGDQGPSYLLCGPASWLSAPFQVKTGSCMVCAMLISKSLKKLRPLSLTA